MSLARLPYFGSDQFPIHASLCYSPQAEEVQEAPSPDTGDHEFAEEKLEKVDVQDEPQPAVAGRQSTADPEFVAWNLLFWRTEVRAVKDDIVRIARPKSSALRAFGAALLLPALAACQQESPAQSTAAQQPRAAIAEDARRTRDTDRTARDRDRQPPRELDEQIARGAPEAATAEVDAGAVGAIAPCTVCHGVNGEGNPALDVPRIGGLDAAYVARQLQHFRTSVRGATDADKYGTQMRAIAISLDDDEVIADLAAYLSGLQPPYAQETTVEGDAAHGAELYAVCTACHGSDGRGSRELSTPSLIGQYDWYLVRQLQNYRNRLRGANPLDTYGLQMAPIVQATLTSDQDIADVVAYITGLPSTTGESPAVPQRAIVQADGAARTLAR